MGNVKSSKKQTSNDAEAPQGSTKKVLKDAVLLGDSTLDNVVWVPGQKHCIAHKLREKGRKIYNLAADGFTSKDMLQGSIPGISFGARVQGNDPFLAKDYLQDPITKVSDPGDFKPLEQVKQLPNLADAICICSFGGNDIRESLGEIQYGSDPNEILRMTLVNYFQVLQELLPLCKQIVICTQYFPDQNNDNYSIYKIFGVEGVKQLMQHIYPPLLKFAVEHNCAIADFANSFDSTNADLYQCQIEPSSEGGDLIVTILDHILNNHKFEKSLIYSLQDGEIKVKDNDGEWTVSA